MYLVDTNELHRGRKANPNVAAWGAEMRQALLYISAVSILEMQIGVLTAEHRDAAGCYVAHVDG